MSEEYVAATGRGYGRGRARGRVGRGGRGSRGRGYYSSSRGSRGSSRGQRGSRGRGGSSRGGYKDPSVHWNNDDKHDEPNELRQILSNMSKSITMLSERLDKMQQNRGLDKNKDSTVSRPTTDEIARPQATKSDNNDFAAVSKCIYKLVQIRYHETNWSKLPVSIDNRLKRLAADIRPAAVDETFQTAMSD